MKLTFVTDLGQSFVVEIDPDMELENVMALLEAEVSLALYLGLHIMEWLFILFCSQGYPLQNRVYIMKVKI